MPDEKVDICNQQGEFLRQGMKREAHTNSLWHKTAHIWVYNSKGQVLLQKRAIAKTTHSGLWDVSCAGHVGAGEEVDETAVRELGEELGLVVKLEDLLKDTIFLLRCDDPSRNYYNRELVQFYFYKWDGDIDELKLQQEEVEQAQWLDLTVFQTELNDISTKTKYVDHGDYYVEVVKKLKKLIVV